MSGLRINKEVEIKFVFVDPRIDEVTPPSSWRLSDLEQLDIYMSLYRSQSDLAIQI